MKKLSLFVSMCLLTPTFGVYAESVDADALEIKVFDLEETDPEESERSLESYFQPTAEELKRSQHLGLQISTDAIRVAIKSALDLMYDGKENAQIDYKAGKYSENFKLENEKYAKMVAAVNELFALDSQKGLKVNINHSAAKITGLTDSKDITYTVKRLSAEKFRIDLSASVKELGVNLPSLTICTDIKYKECKGGNFIKFKDIYVGLDKKGPPIKINLALELSFTPVEKLVEGRTVQTKAIALKALKVSSNLGAKKPPKLSIKYFEGKLGGVEYPQISANQVGPAGFGLSITSQDLKNEINLYKEDLGKQIISAGNKFIATDMIKFLNNVLEERVFPSDFWLAYTGSDKPIATAATKVSKKPDGKNEYAAKIGETYVYRIPAKKDKKKGAMDFLVNMIHDFTYGIKIADLSVPQIRGTQYFNLLVDTDLTLNGEKMIPDINRGFGPCKPFAFATPTPTPKPKWDDPYLKPQPVDNTYVKPVFIPLPSNKVYPNCERPLGKIAFEASNQEGATHNMAFALSESYINSILKLADKKGFIKELAKVQLNKPGVYIGEQGIRFHAFKNHKGAVFAYVVANVKIVLKEQPSWSERVGGPIIEDWFGSTGGVIEFPIEIPVWFKVKGEKLVMEGLSPFEQALKDDNYEDLQMRNSFGYKNNIEQAAKTWIDLTNIQMKIKKQMYEALQDLINKKKTNIHGANFLNPVEIDIKSMLGTLPVDFNITSVGVEDTGHVIIYGKVNKLDLKPLVEGRK